ncbi:plasmid pRiA4b ORF-3 family protein [Sediminibacterium sp. C3]|uniref:plasmid pRiA4b ORF-3 family protein n=1 Tax=Sediminibacterium sp. C3 TaxID=1267211 RepID=UPI00041EF0FE|nr:plasmid pRiA4b ORF-3 family protein [Sediminibacterium sp. C3]
MLNILVLEIILDHTEPLIWRKIIVPTNFTLNRLHHAVQIAMGWNNSHLFEFNYENFSIGIVYTDLEDNPNIDAREITLEEVNLQIGDELKYIYDFGDYWEHTIKVVDNKFDKPIKQLPYCITGKLNSPPEDVGGISGFYHFVEVMKNFRHKEFKETLVWYGGFFDPLKYSTAKINTKYKRFEKYMEHFE